MFIDTLDPRCFIERCYFYATDLHSQVWLMPLNHASERLMSA
jgi:hypothetical protein